LVKAMTDANSKPVPHATLSNLGADLAATLLTAARGTATIVIQRAVASAGLFRLTGTASDARTCVVVSNHTAIGFLNFGDKMIKLKYGAKVGSVSFMM